MQNCGQKRKECKKSICQRFLESLIDDGVESLEDIQPEHVRNFIVKISETRPKSMDDVIHALCGFFKYLCGNGLYHDSFWMLPAAPRCRDYHVRGCLASDEITLLPGCTGRESADGKRDFAAMSLAAASGLRASDIASLMLDDIDWRRHEIRLIQGKTSEPLILPMPKAVLNAMADYILNGRPETADRNVFVRHCAPFKGYNDGVSFECIFRRYQKNRGRSIWLVTGNPCIWDASNPAGSSVKVRVYLLRHRYATVMFMKWLNEKADLNAMLPCLSAYMGHTNFSDTAYYIHLLPENLPASDAVDWEKLNALIPEVEDEE